MLRYNYKDVNSHSAKEDSVRLEVNMKFLVKKTESHVVILFFLLGFFLLGFSCRCSSTCRSSSSSRCSCSGSWHGTNLLLALGDQLFNVLAGQFIDNQVDFLVISINTNRAENFLDVSSRGFPTSKGSKKCSGNVTHF